MEELKRFQGSTFDTIARLVEDPDTILELTRKIQELHKSHCTAGSSLSSMMRPVRLCGSACDLPLTHDVHHGGKWDVSELTLQILRLGRLKWNKSNLCS